MANIADTCYKLVINEPQVAQDIYGTLQQLNKKGYNIRLCDLAEHYGIDYEKERISVRGSIYYFDLDEEDEVLTIETESAWTANVELFDAIAAKFEDHISVSYRCVECGCEVFEVRDNGNFFPEECLVSAYGEPFGGDGFEEPFMSIYDAINFWAEKVGFERDGRSDEEMREIIDNFDYSDPDAFFYLYEFEFE